MNNLLSASINDLTDLTYVSPLVYTIGLKTGTTFCINNVIQECGGETLTSYYVVNFEVYNLESEEVIECFEAKHSLASEAFDECLTNFEEWLTWLQPATPPGYY